MEHAEPNPTRMAHSPALMALGLSAGRVHSLRAIEGGIDSLGKSSSETTDLLAAFLKDHSDLGQEFLNRAQIDRQALEEAINLPRAAEPPPPPPTLPDNPTADQRKLFELLDITKSAPVFSGPLRQVLLRLKEGEVAGASQVTVGIAIARIASEDGNAGSILRELTSESNLQTALDWLRIQPDPTEKIDFMSALKEHTFEVLKRAWPKEREQSSSPKVDAIRDKHYEEDPSSYEEPLDIAKRLALNLVDDPEKDYMWRVGVCLHAAQNEARIRRAPEVTFDHLVIALLRDGTDFAAFLDRLGVDRGKWAKRFDDALPRFEEGSRWPPNDLIFGVSQPSNVRMQMDDSAKDLDADNLNLEEAMKKVKFKAYINQHFTDLAYFKATTVPRTSLVQALLQEEGISEDSLRAEITAIELRDRDWWSKPIELVAELDYPNRTTTSRSIRMNRPGIARAAVQFEARRRNAPALEIDDVLVALLVPGTDLWHLVDELGTPPEVVRAAVDNLRPRFEKGPYFPEFGVDQLFSFHVLGDTFSDLSYVEEAFLVTQERNPSLTPGLLFLESIGLNQEVLNARLDKLHVRRFRR